MNQLIKVNCNTDRPTVLGRDLHEFLEVKTAYKDWFPRMIEYGFYEGTDYCSFLSDRSDGLAGKPRQDHQLTIEMAKEISMLQRNEKGKQARHYFIQLEKNWNSPEKVMARALQIADKKIHSLTEQIEQDKPKVIFADAVSTAKSDILIGEMAKLLKQNGIEIGEKRLFEWLRENGYLIKRKGTDWNSPTQKSMDMSLFRTKETTVCHADGHTTINKTPKVTGKGQVYFINLFLNSGR